MRINLKSDFFIEFKILKLMTISLI